MNPVVKHKIDEITGELYVETNAMMKGYYDDPVKTAEAFTDDGFYKTGDTINVADDEEDTLKFMVVSRNKQVIVAENGRCFSHNI